ncbi:unnamed protein product, partial [Meganyctiphanes norvegica]
MLIAYSSGLVFPRGLVHTPVSMYGFLVYAYCIYQGPDICSCDRFQHLGFAYCAIQCSYKHLDLTFGVIHTILWVSKTLPASWDESAKGQSQNFKTLFLFDVVTRETSANGFPKAQGQLNPVPAQPGAWLTFPYTSILLEREYVLSSILWAALKSLNTPPPVNGKENRQLCAHPFIEVYDNENSQILFVGPLERQDDFYVPEVQDDEEEMQDDDGDLATEASSRSRDESASFIRSGTGTETGTEYNDSECSESVADDSSSHQVVPPVEAPPVVEMPPPPPPPAPVTAAAAVAASAPSPQQAPASQTEDTAEAASRSGDSSSSSIIVANVQEVVEIIAGGADADADADDSDANTGSSFEEIDEATAASLPSMDIPQVDEKISTTITTKEDEGER